MKIIKCAALSTAIALSLATGAKADINFDRILERTLDSLARDATREMTRENYPRRERSPYGVDEYEMDDYRLMLRICMRQRNNPDFNAACRELTR